ncbi:MAG: hypothetical protein MZV70_56170 [Desulfobacterales bacterium]|nr:hypothetical protein [Desulfobacterales bacterium]
MGDACQSSDPTRTDGPADRPTGPSQRASASCRDSAFQFYYPENIEALQAAGAEIVFVSPLREDTLPDVDALYIGGGFPETHAQELAANTGFSRRMRELVEDGFPVYAECGGLMYLGEELVLEGRSYPMAGVLPLSFGLFKRPQGHGYTVVIGRSAKTPTTRSAPRSAATSFTTRACCRWSGSEERFRFPDAARRRHPRRPRRDRPQKRPRHLHPHPRPGQPRLGKRAGPQCRRLPIPATPAEEILPNRVRRMPGSVGDGACPRPTCIKELGAPFET